MKQITVATYNIRHGYDVSYDWKRLASVIHASGADMIGLQEIDMKTRRVAGRDTIEGLKEATGFPYAHYIPAMDFDGGRYGTAILSRYPIRDPFVQSLDAGPYEPRAFGGVTVEIPDGVPLCFLNTHLSFKSKNKRCTQMEEIAAWISTHIPTDMPLLLTGDFNTENFDAFSPIKELGYDLVNREDHRFDTFREPPAAIDNIVYRAGKLSPLDFGMIDKDTSDHNLLWCRFEIHA